MTETDKYYYFPTMTKNIMFVKGEKYVCMSEYVNRKMIKGNIYICDDFKNGNYFLTFKDDLGNSYNVSAFDCGSFLSIPRFRKYKLNILNEKIKNNKIKNCKM